MIRVTAFEILERKVFLSTSKNNFGQWLNIAIKNKFLYKGSQKRLHDITESCKVELARNSMKTVSVLGWKYDMKVGSKAYPFATLVV